MPLTPFEQELIKRITYLDEDHRADLHRYANTICSFIADINRADNESDGELGKTRAIDTLRENMRALVKQMGGSCSY